MTRAFTSFFVCAFLMATSSAVSGKWKVKTKVSPVDDSKNVYISTKAVKKIRTDWPRCSSIRPSLHVDCSESELHVYVWTCSPADTENADGTYTILLRFDKEEAFETNAVHSTDRSALFFENPQDLLSKMIKHKQMLFRFTPFRCSPQITYFKMKNFNRAFMKIRESCSDEYASIMEESFKGQCWDHCTETYSYLEQEKPELKNWAEVTCVEECLKLSSIYGPIKAVKKKKKEILLKAEANLKKEIKEKAKEEEERKREAEREGVNKKRAAERKTEERRLEAEREAKENKRRAEVAAEAQRKLKKLGLTWVKSKPAGISFTKTEVTIMQYSSCVESGACEEPRNKDDNKYCNWGHVGRDKHPVNCVEWKQANDFCSWSGGRLPTAKEWYEEASNKGTRKYPWGNAELTCEYAIWGDGIKTNGCGRKSTWQVCSKERGNSVSGLCDMSGNVWEWTSSSSSVGSSRLVRGGSWDYEKEFYIRASYRSSENPKDWNFNAVGFRCVLP